MKTSVLVTVGLALTCASLAGRAHPRAQNQSAAALTSAGARVPRFERDAMWPRGLAGRRLGSVSAASIDQQNHVWVIHRPRTLPESLRADALPPVIELDEAGDVIRMWGGQDTGQYEWPEIEHSIHVDRNGYVWILGNGPRDGQILKFRTTGQFVMQIGHRGAPGDSNSRLLNRPSGLWVEPKTNELFVSDGYGNRRVIVFDAATGAYKRHWGAYGRPPVDIGPPRFDPSNPWRGFAEHLQQFDTVHDVKIANDGRVYVADRGHKRVQVFNLAGTYLAQQFVGLDSVEYLHARSVAFSGDARQEFLYVAGNPQVWILERESLRIIGAIETGEVQRHPPNHEIATDGHGNLFTTQAAATEAGDSDTTVGIQKFRFVGVSGKN